MFIHITGITVKFTKKIPTIALMFEFDQISPASSLLPEFVFRDEHHWVFVASIPKKSNPEPFNERRDACLDFLTKRIWGRSAQIVRDGFGKPFLRESNAFISLSHTKEQLALIISKSYSPGIDIEDLRPSLRQVATRMLSDIELNYSALKVDTQKALQYCWGAKEAVYKSWGIRKLTFNKHMILKDFVPENPTMIEILLKKDGHIREYTLRALQLASGEFLVFTTSCSLISEPR